MVGNVVMTIWLWDKGLLSQRISNELASLLCNTCVMQLTGIFAAVPAL